MSDSAAGADAQAVTATLRNGRRVTIREAQRGDASAIGEFLEGLSLEARWLRFFAAAIDVEAMTSQLTEAGPGRLALLALDEHGTIVGHAVSIELGPGRAEVAVEVADGHHGEGLGTILIERLAEIAEERGVATFEAVVLPENREMLDVFRDGFEARIKVRGGVDAVEFPTSAWRGARERYGGLVSGARD